LWVWVPLQILQSVSRLRIEFLKKDYSETIINNLPGIFYLYDESGKFLKWNENFELVTGYNSHEISQMTPLDLLMRMRKKRSASELLSSKKNLRD
jgi:PAS domain S-box-containing protein